MLGQHFAPSFCRVSSRRKKWFCLFECKNLLESQANNMGLVFGNLKKSENEREKKKKQVLVSILSRDANSVQRPGHQHVRNPSQRATRMRMMMRRMLMMMSLQLLKALHT